MNRELKFRGRRKNDGSWIYGDLCRQELTTCIFPQDAYDSYTIIIVDESTVGQYTGLKDKNGVEIYEGDIIIEKIKRSRKDGERLVICFEEFEWKGENVNGATTSLSLLAEYHTIEVVGNIHDNPELLIGNHYE